MRGNPLLTHSGRPLMISTMFLSQPAIKRHLFQFVSKSLNYKRAPPFRNALNTHLAVHKYYNRFFKNMGITGYSRRKNIKTTTTMKKIMVPYSAHSRLFTFPISNPHNNFTRYNII